MAKKTVKRIYSAKDIVMITVLAIILENAKDNLAELTAENENWTALLLDTLNQIIIKAKNIIGTDTKKGQKEATDKVKEIMPDAVKALVTFNRVIKKAIPDVVRRKQILDDLGINKNWAKASRNNQLSMVELLLTFKKNLTTDLKTEITKSKDMKAVKLDAITALAGVLEANNIDQEKLKVSSKTLTEDDILVLNDAYKQVVNDFSSYVFGFYKDQGSPKKSLFSFTGIKKVVNGK
jgi:hypothetical protein